jgi:hypothetical protein
VVSSTTHYREGSASVKLLVLPVLVPLRDAISQPRQDLPQLPDDSREMQHRRFDHNNSASYCVPSGKT